MPDLRRADARRGIAFLVIAVSILCHLSPSAWADLRAEAVGYFNEGQQLQQKGDAAGAMTAFQKSAGLDPGSAEPLCAMGALYDQRGQTAMAQRAYETALARQPNHLAANLGLAALYEHTGHQASALAYWLKSGVIAEQTSNLPQAAKALEHALALDQENLETYTNLAKVYERLNRKDTALAYWLKLGVLAEAQGAPERASLRHWTQEDQGRLGQR